jgi:hypothetical protein
MSCYYWLQVLIYDDNGVAFNGTNVHIELRENQETGSKGEI